MSVLDKRDFMTSALPTFLGSVRSTTVPYVCWSAFFCCISMRFGGGNPLDSTPFSAFFLFVFLCDWGGYPRDFDHIISCVFYCVPVPIVGIFMTVFYITVGV
jgi:hypothetical protein